MTHRTLILVIRRLSERARKAEKAALIVSFDVAGRRVQHLVLGDHWVADKCRAKIDQLTERYS